MDDDGSVRFLDDVGKNAEGGRNGSITRTKVDINVGAVLPIDMRCMDGILNLILVFR
jgi:hypothetical protein